MAHGQWATWQRAKVEPGTEVQVLCVVQPAVAARRLLIPIAA